MNPTPVHVVHAQRRVVALLPGALFPWALFPGALPPLNVTTVTWLPSHQASWLPSADQVSGPST
jgi:hypothetical protein